MVTNDKEERKKWDKNYREKNKEKVKESQKKYQDSENGKAKRKKIVLEIVGKKKILYINGKNKGILLFLVFILKLNH